MSDEPFSIHRNKFLKKMIVHRMWEGLKIFNYSITSLNASAPGGIHSIFNTYTASTQCQRVSLSQLVFQRSY